MRTIARPQNYETRLLIDARGGVGAVAAQTVDFASRPVDRHASGPGTRRSTTGEAIVAAEDQLGEVAATGKADRRSDHRYN